MAAGCAAGRELGAALNLSNGHCLGRLSGRGGEGRRAASRRSAGVPKQLGQALDAALLPEYPTTIMHMSCDTIMGGGLHGQKLPFT